MNLIRLEELSMVSNAVLTPQLNNWPAVLSTNVGDASCKKHKDNFLEPSDKKFYKEWLEQQKKILKSIPSNAVLLSMKDPI
jgi:antibiotic biosynthesis monooxygenase (ABM) superfamily enzyme